MTKINDTLVIDLKEDIKSVIDVEDQSEQEIQQEIESYIVTEGIAEHLYNFTNQYTSNIKETGVWISGFYGSGKSYFGKILGNIISNPQINGTSAIDRFIPRLKGVSNESIIENEIRKLESIKSHVIFLDIAKQNTEKGLAFTLFTNFLKHLGFRDDIYGYIEYDLYIDDKQDEYFDKCKEIFSEDWNELKRSNRKVAKATRQLFMELGYSEKDYSNTHDVYSKAIESFSANKFKEEITKYLSKNPEEILVFIFDEASEAIGQDKISLIDLEGVSEALSSITNKVWTIAIAQEKLDDVINNANVNRSQLTKVTDRFKTKIHLESTEVDVIIRSRLLQKQNKYVSILNEYYVNNDGLISDSTNLKSLYPTKTESVDDFTAYYPFHKYQFQLLQKFLFSSNALVATQIAARGMIITTFDVLRRRLNNKQLFNFITAHDICSEAQTTPPTSLGLKYDNAIDILKNNKSDINGDKLLKAIHFLSNSELVFPTIENITKSYIGDLSEYYDIKPKIENALGLLVDSKILLLSNNNYKITSDLEGKLLDEMRDFDVELFLKKRELVTYLKKSGRFSSVSAINEDTVSYKFNIITDQEDDISSSSNKSLNMVVYSLFNITDDRQEFIEKIKQETQYNKDKITLIPDNSQYDIIDKLITEVKRYSYMEEKYSNDSDQDRRQILREFSTIKEEKEKTLKTKIEEAYNNGTLIYMYDAFLLNSDNFKGTINELQKKLVKNIYTKRLKTQLSESIAPKILKEMSNDKLHRYFSNDEFKFFDANGNFTGDHLKVIEELTSIINSKYVNGKSIEIELSQDPWGYQYGTIVTTLAALFRAGRLIVRYNGNEYYDYKDKSIHEVFATSSRFKIAAYKSISKTLSSSQKNKLVQVLLDLDIKDHIGKNIDWNTNDFELADSIKLLAEHFIDIVNSMENTMPDFDKYFSNTLDQKETLQEYSSKTTESNYINKVEFLLERKEPYITAIKTIIKTQKFIKRNYEDIKIYKRFAEDVVGELKKANKQNDIIAESYDEFNSLYSKDLVSNYSQLREFAQKIKDEYHNLMKNAADLMTSNYQTLKKKIEKVAKELKANYPENLNQHNIVKLNDLKDYCNSRVVKEIKLEFNKECRNCKFSLSDINDYIELAPTKEAELITIQSSFVKEKPKPGGSGKPKSPKKITFKTSKKVMPAKEYRSLLSDQLKSLAGLNDDDEVEITFED